MTDYKCPKCKKGILKTYVNESLEAETSELYTCSTCRFQTIIPSLSIILGQITTGSIGSTFATYLFLQQALEINEIIQLSPNLSYTKPVTLLSLSFFLLAGLGYTLIMGVNGLLKRRLFKKYVLSPKKVYPSSRNA